MYKLTPDAYTIIVAALRECLTETVDNKDFDSARYVLGLIEHLEKEVKK